MKKLSILLLAILFVGQLFAQPIISDKDSIGYLMPDFWRFGDCNARGLVPGLAPTPNVPRRAGCVLPKAIEGTVIYGIVAMMETPQINVHGVYTPLEHPEPWAFLYRPGGQSYTAVDSVKINIDTPSRYLIVPQYNYYGGPFHMASAYWAELNQLELMTYMDTATRESLCIFPLYESYFRHGYPIDDTSYAMLLGSTYAFMERTGAFDHYIHFYGIATYPNDRLLGICHVLSNDSIYFYHNLVYQYPIFAITDRN
ncbi:MAG: hypothetical protein K5864_03810 [Bacteroidales bacterium]|nr:hypothetical protein [Bacteroidales bacterium]